LAADNLSHRRRGMLEYQEEPKSKSALDHPLPSGWLIFS
jgi:hypothetical protein